jgi:hypothetical protein
MRPPTPWSPSRDANANANPNIASRTDSDIALGTPALRRGNSLFTTQVCAKPARDGEGESSPVGWDAEVMALQAVCS